MLKIKFIKGTIDFKSATVKSIGQIGEDTLENLEKEVIKDPHYCFFFYPNDIPNIGSPINKNISREMYEKEPEKYGVALYKTSFRKSVTYE